ncbi:MAG: cytochrome c biogenesis protein CcsA, partial [Desulfobulbaceae bacterium]|nr:cytochrome c biogenesis protein CcsA [Desulfobulbaceae bacterium]
TPCILAFLLMLRCCLRPLPEKIERRVWQLGLTAMAVCLLAAQIFPKNFYLPFLRSESPFAHVMLLAGAGGRACFLASMAWGVVFFAPAAVEERRLCLRHSLRWAIWGFALWTLAMFSGEMWAYLGWGTPVIWHDPAILLMMAVWFLYIAFLHLHFSKLWGQHSRAAFAAVGGCTAVVLSLLADFGPFRPFW